MTTITIDTAQSFRNPLPYVQATKVLQRRRAHGWVCWLVEVAAPTYAVWRYSERGAPYKVKGGMGYSEAIDFMDAYKATSGKRKSFYAKLGTWFLKMTDDSPRLYNVVEVKGLDVGVSDSDAVREIALGFLQGLLFCTGTGEMSKVAEAARVEDFSSDLQQWAELASRFFFLTNRCEVLQAIDHTDATAVGHALAFDASGSGAGFWDGRYDGLAVEDEKLGDRLHKAAKVVNGLFGVENVCLRRRGRVYADKFSVYNMLPRALEGREVPPSALETAISILQEGTRRGTVVLSGDDCAELLAAIGDKS